MGRHAAVAATKLTCFSKERATVAVTTELVVVRHGEANCNVTGIVGGDRGCTGLSPRGRKQARKLAARLAAEHRDRPFRAIYGTPRRRVRETVATAAFALSSQPTIVDDLRGPDHGEADGLLWSDMKAAFGGPPQHRPDEPYAPGAEPWNAYLDRAHRTLQSLLDEHVGDRILVVAHGETIEAAHTLLLRLPPEVRVTTGYVTDHTGISRWQRHVNRFDRETWMLTAHNDTRHLVEPCA